MKNNKSFTLIELLVVIAVIGLLAGMIFVSLSAARNRARDSRIVVDLRQIKTIALLINNTYGSYANLCDVPHTLNQIAPAPFGDQLKAIEDDLFEQAGVNPYSARCCATATTYCVSSIFSNLDLICIDETGVTHPGKVCGTPDMPGECAIVACLPPPAPPPPPPPP